MSLTIHSSVKNYPRLPYKKMAADILGDAYDLSLVFVGNAQAQKLNQTYRKKSYIPNVLSFPIDMHTGEIFINPNVAKKEAPLHGMSERGFIGFLFIHALLHLDGHHHGDTMEKAEARYKKRYGLV
jgi:rRNA maturation RNase YbeY